MVKKILAAVLCLLLTFTVCIGATTDTTETPATQEQQTTQPTEGQMPGRGMGGRGGMGGQRPEGMPQGEMPQGEPPAMPEGMQSPTQETQTDTGTAQDDTTQPDQPRQGNMSGMDGFGSMNGDWQSRTETAGSENITEPTSLTEFFSTYQTPIFSVVLLAAAFVFVIFYKRKRY